ncbi:AraC family transcriptional regulator ligand-binding domain-containing protein, partial [Pontibacter sp. JAM-7]|uniref:AraC family transcriptional regulator n=1 Tax=Pontibacter sp. JAM-7 TaxID=3366581 RepID=UPI003AF8EDA4
CRFYNLTTQAFILDFYADKDTAYFTMRLTNPSLDVQHMLIDFLLLIWHRFPAWLTGQRIPLTRVTFDFPAPEHAREYRLLFPCPVEFDQSVSGFSFPASCLNWPVVQTRNSLREHLHRAPLDWFEKQNYYPTYTRRVLDALTAEQQFHNLQIEEIAHNLAMTSRTLRRKLADEHTSFRDIKHIARRDTAIHLLSLRNLPVGRIAHMLGFTEAASFSRAFKEWTGVTPHFYKK